MNTKNKYIDVDDGDGDGDDEVKNKRNDLMKK